MDQATALRALREARNLNRAVRNAKQRANEATEEAVVGAFKANMGITQIASESGVSESKIRAIRDKFGIPPDPRYAHLKPPMRADSDGSETNVEARDEV